MTDREPTTQTSGLDLIVCDDEAMIAAIIVRRLTQVGHTVRQFPNGQQAFESARAKPPDAIITDYQMPLMDGLQLAEAMAALPELAQIPIFLVTARGHRVPDEVLARTSIVRVIPKPFSASELALWIGREVTPRSRGEAA